MKSLLLLCCSVLMMVSVHAQFEKGQKLIDGQIGFSNLSNQTDANSPKRNYSSLNTAFSLLQFSSPTRLNGFGVNLGYADNGADIIYRNVGAFYQCTQLETLAKKFYLSFTGNAGINYSATANYYPLINGVSFTKAHSLSPYASINMGLLYQLNNRFILQTQLINIASLSYQMISTDNFNSNNNLAYTSKQNNVYFNSGLSQFNLNNISFGFKWMLKK